MNKIDIIKFNTNERHVEFFNIHLKNNTHDYIVFINTDVITKLEDNTVTDLINDMKRYDEIFTCMPYTNYVNMLIHGVKNPKFKLFTGFMDESMLFFETPCEDFMIFKNINKTLNEAYKQCYIREYLLKYNKKVTFFRFNEKFLENFHYTKYIKIINQPDYNQEMQKLFDEFPPIDNYDAIINKYKKEKNESIEQTNIIEK